LLLADEPTGNLDSATSHEVMEIFANLCAKRGITIVVITHERDIAAYGTRTVDFKDGLIVSDRLNRPFDSHSVRNADETLAQGGVA
jgi:putative ABC transport system ATP-binding protein